MTTIGFDLIVVGAGPAGLSAAVTASQSGAKVLLIDGGDHLGGHYFKELPDNFPAGLDRQEQSLAEELASYRQALADAQVTILRDTQVWGIFQGQEATFEDPLPTEPGDSQEPYTLYLDGPESSPHTVTAPVLILAPGVFDRPLPFPGWTLPGVITPGAAQMLLKRQGLLPGRRILVAGSGPLQLAVAANLAQAGAEIVAVLDLCALTEGLAQAPAAFWGQWDRLKEFSGYLLELARQRVPMRFRQAVRRVEGDAERGINAVIAGPVDAQGHPCIGPELRYAVDTLCCAYGFLPSTHLTLHLGCQHTYKPDLGAFVPAHDARMQTDRPNVFVAGDVTGVGGKPLAVLQGQIAALSALENLGKLNASSASNQRARLLPDLERESRFERFLWQRFRFRPGVLDALDDQTVICRCEGVTLGDVRQSFRNGVRTIAGAKLHTRLGMGICQGRYCVSNANAILASLGGHSPSEVGLMHIRPPIVPVRIANIYGPEG